MKLFNQLLPDSMTNSHPELFRGIDIAFPHNTDIPLKRFILLGFLMAQNT